MLNDDPNDHVQNGRHNHGDHSAQLVPDTVPGRLAGPVPSSQSGSRARHVVDGHTGNPGQYQPAKPAPEGGESCAEGREGGFKSVDVLHDRYSFPCAFPAHTIRTTSWRVAGAWGLVPSVMPMATASSSFSFAHSLTGRAAFSASQRAM